VNRHRVCARADSRRQLEAAAERSQAAIAAAVLWQEAADGKARRREASGRRTASISLTANASGLPDLSLKLAGSGFSDGDAEPRRAAPPRRSPRQLAMERLRSGLRRTLTLPASLWRASASAAPTPRLPGAGGAAANGSPSRQPLTGRLQPSSSQGDLGQAAQQAAEGEQRQLAAVQAAERAAVEAAAPCHQRRLTLSFWAEPPPPPLDLSQQPGEQRLPDLHLSASDQEGGRAAAASPASGSSQGAGSGGSVLLTAPRRSLSAGEAPLRAAAASQQSSFIHLTGWLELELYGRRSASSVVGCFMLTVAPASPCMQRSRGHPPAGPASCPPPAARHTLQLLLPAAETRLKMGPASWGARRARPGTAATSAAAPAGSSSCTASRHTCSSSWRRSSGGGTAPAARAAALPLPPHLPAQTAPRSMATQPTGKQQRPPCRRCQAARPPERLAGRPATQPALGWRRLPRRGLRP
jgi:hypothetical protein